MSFTGVALTAMALVAAEVAISSPLEAHVGLAALTSTTTEGQEEAEAGDVAGQTVGTCSQQEVMAVVAMGLLMPLQMNVSDCSAH